MLAGIIGSTPLAMLALACALVTYTANRLLMPVYHRYALARPNARSSHKVPTPQGGGAGALLAILAGLLVLSLVPSGLPLRAWSYLALPAAAVLIAVVGALDDLRELPVRQRLAAQFAASGVGLLAILAATPAPLPWWLLVPAVPVLLVGLVWFINLTNFMDGLDGLSIAEFVPVCASLALLSAAGVVPSGEGAVAAALAGSLLGFWPHNRHVARLFLGDVGSLFIGLLAGCLLTGLALAGEPVAAVILPLYYIADATLTLLHRLLHGEDVTKAHRTHFYQRATDLGWTVPAITGRVWLVNVALALLAFASVAFGSGLERFLLLVAAAALVRWLLSSFSRAPAS